MLEPKDILFVGMGTSAVCWYRVALPALHMGADWVGVHGQPPDLYVATGLVRDRTALPRYEDYKVVILQQPAGRKWLHKIRDLQSKGIKVLYEIDDYLHGVRKQEDHDFRESYGKDVLAEYELCMGAADGLLVSTEFLATKYRRFNRTVFVCENGIDMARYRLTKPERPMVNIGWAGATGHLKTLTPWLQQVAFVMRDNPQTCFVAIGQSAFATAFQQKFGQHRAIGVPWTMIENYPAAMTMIDVAIAPAGKTLWWRGKSDLRWLEAGALGIPIVADPSLYPKITHGVDGFHATTPQEVRACLTELAQDADLRQRIGAAAKNYVEEHREIRRTAGNWLRACALLCGDS